MTRKYKIGIFEDEDKFLTSIKSLIEREYRIHDVFTPYPVNEVFRLLKRKSRLPTAAYFFGLFAILASLSFLYYTSVVNWPVVYGGKPYNSFPSFIVVTIILTILTVTLLSLALFSARSRLFPGRENTIFNGSATNDKFIIVVDTGTPEDGMPGEAGSLMEKEGAVEVFDKELESINE
jgi:hypothetical protein